MSLKAIKPGYVCPGRINSFLKRAFKYGLCSQLFSFLDLADDADQTLFNSMLKNNIVSK